MKKYILTGMAACALLAACTKDRDFPQKPVVNDIEEGDILINEYAVNGPTLVNEFGNSDDWVELYNTTADTVFLNQSRFYISDDETDPYKYTLDKDTFISPNGFLLVFADGLDTTATQIHTNFSLSAAGEYISIFALNSQNQAVAVDNRTYGPQPSGQSEGRTPNGGNNWTLYSNPTPGASNQ
ncbi:MAG: lamin tail domain-containing protein [Sphingobacteriales bacterium JAD_PAG50586_3]|nr:MAG: lamin tail domain-containing protein [Sphingobacteriales bacterium JAD_PAG50586_3]